MSDIIDRACSIANAQEHITYPSRPAAQHVRNVMRELAQAFVDYKLKRIYVAAEGRDTTEAAKSLASAEDAWLKEIAHRDPGMIRDVAAALLYTRSQ